MNSELIENYFLELEKASISQTTINSYKNDLETLNIFLGAFSIVDFDKTMLMNYIDFLKDNFTNNTLIRKLNSFKSFYKYLLGKNIVTENILDELKNFKNDYSIPEILSQEELENLYKACDPSEKGKRDILVIKLLLKTGMQLNKVLDLNTGDVTEDTISFVKSDKKFLIKVDEELRTVIIQYKNSSICGENKLFQGLSRQNFFTRIKKYQKDAGIEREINPVMLKNTAIYSFIEEGTPMRELKEKLDYANIGMTGIYKIRNKADIKKVYEKIGIGDWDVSTLDK